jgi:hypothetical protein
MQERTDSSDMERPGISTCTPKGKVTLFNRKKYVAPLCVGISVKHGGAKHD